MAISRAYALLGINILSTFVAAPALAQGFTPMPPPFIEMGDLSARPFRFGKAWRRAVTAAFDGARRLPRAPVLLQFRAARRLGFFSTIDPILAPSSTSEVELVWIEGDAIAPVGADLHGQSFVVGGLAFSLPWSVP